MGNRLTYEGVDGHVGVIVSDIDVFDRQYCKEYSMRQFLGLAIASAFLLSSTAVAEELKSGLGAGEMIGPFTVTKCAGAEDDSVEMGETLCYRCKNGSRPQVIVFTRGSNEKLVKLVKGLDAQLSENEDAQLRAFVNVMDESRDVASDKAKKLAATAKAKHIPFVVPTEFENGPENYGINPKAELTIIFANEAKVVANYSVSKLDELDIEAAMAHLKKIL